jgi:hypothetical protein
LCHLHLFNKIGSILKLHLETVGYYNQPSEVDEAMDEKQEVADMGEDNRF